MADQPEKAPNEEEPLIDLQKDDFARPHPDQGPLQELAMGIEEHHRQVRTHFWHPRKEGKDHTED